MAEDEVNYDRLKAAAKGRKFQRRVSLWEAYKSVAFDLDILGQKTEYSSYVRIDGIERRFADVDYRLLVEHGAIPKETELIAGVVFWKKDVAHPDTTDLD